MQLDFTLDPYTWDGVENVRFYPSTSAGPRAAIPLPLVHRGPLTNRELQTSNGAYVGLDVALDVPAAALPFPPKPRDTWTDAAGVTYTVLDVRRVGIGAVASHYRLISRDPVIVFDLHDTVDIETPAVTYDAAGGPVRGWSAAYPGLPCKVQPAEAHVSEERGVVGGETTYSVFLMPVVIANVRECRVKWGSVYLDVDRYRDAESIGNLATLECRLKP